MTETWRKALKTTLHPLPPKKKKKKNQKKPHNNNIETTDDISSESDLEKNRKKITKGKKEERKTETGGRNDLFQPARKQAERHFFPRQYPAQIGNHRKTYRSSAESNQL